MRNGMAEAHSANGDKTQIPQMGIKRGIEPKNDKKSIKAEMVKLMSIICNFVASSQFRRNCVASLQLCCDFVPVALQFCHNFCRIVSTFVTITSHRRVFVAILPSLRRNFEKISVFKNIWVYVKMFLFIKLLHEILSKDDDVFR